MQILEERYVLMSKDKLVIAKGVPRNRYLCLVSEKDRKRLLTYSTENMAKANDKGFFTSKGVNAYMKERNMRWNDEIKLEPVKVITSIV